MKELGLPISRLPATPHLIGRAPELATLFGLIDRLPERGGALVICGESGIGKTSLLTVAAQHANDNGVQVQSTLGVHSEEDMAFSGLHRLVRPFLTETPNALEQLPKRQRDALANAFGISSGPTPNPFLVGLAALSLLSALAKERSLLFVVDDAQWLDRDSARTLAFVARRLSAESVVIIFAVDELDDDLRGLPALAIEGLSDAYGRQLLDSVVPWRLDGRVRERILAETHGNPLALVELPKGLSPAQLAGGYGLSAVMPHPESLSASIEESFLRRVDALPADSRLLLLVAAAESMGDAGLLWRAAKLLGIPFAASTPAAAAELLEVDVRVRFRHPLVRSAIYRRAPLAERQRVHRALADATQGELDPDRRAWHNAQAAAGPDEDIALELERSAGRARARGGIAAEAAFLERAVALTLDPRLRTERALVAARAKFEIAALDVASTLLATAELGPLDQLQRARLERLRAQIAFARTGSADIPGLTIGPEAPALLLEAAKRLEPLDAELARETYLEALTAAMIIGPEGGTGVRAVAEAARNAPRGPEPQRPVDLLLDGLALRFTETYAAAFPALREALRAFAWWDDRQSESPRWLWFACPVAPEPLALDLWDDETWHDISTRAVRICRDTGSLAILPNALTYRATLHVLAGEFAAAEVLMDEAYSIADAIGSAPLRYPSLLLAAWRGQENAAMKAIGAGIQDAKARGLQSAIGFSHCVTALLYNGLGRYHDALAAARRARACFPVADIHVLGWALIELIEAGVRSDCHDLASAAMVRLEERTRTSGTDWALGIEARSRALLSEGDSAESLYREAIDRLSRTRIHVELARAHLHYGEWLRRENRRVDAREQLRRARDQFAAMGAEAFAARASRELVATVEGARQRSDDTRYELTPWETQIAQLARQGLTNPEIGTQLFISPRTVEWHLRNVFLKLGITSRKGLRAALPDSGRGGRTPVASRRPRATV